MMKKILMQTVGSLVTSILRWIDYRFYHSSTAMTDDEVIANPYTHYNEIRSHGKFLRSQRNRGWMALGYDEVQAVLRENRLGADMRKNEFVSKMIRLAAEGRKVTFLDDPTMLNLDPPDHTRLRKLANHGFINKQILALEPRIAELVDNLLDAIDPGSDSFDVVKVIAEPLPVSVIAELLGLPEEDQPRFLELSRQLVGILALGNTELMDAGACASEELSEYFARQIEGKRQSPGDDLISKLIEVEEEGDRLSNEELISTCIVLLVAGHETTTHLIGNGMHLLLQHPAEMQKLRQNPALIPNAVEEMLRMEPPVNFTARTALENFELFGEQVQENQIVMAVFASANRDPDRFPDPDKFDVTREEPGHMAFGYGIHLCLGMTLARLEAKVAFEKILARYPNLGLVAQEISYVPVPINRGRESLLVSTA